VFAGLIGALALGSALAFGLGAATSPVSSWGAYPKGQENKAQLKRELKLGKERVKQEAEKIKEENPARSTLTL
jgi:hypothetical protein